MYLSGWVKELGGDVLASSPVNDVDFDVWSGGIAWLGSLHPQLDGEVRLNFRVVMIKLYYFKFAI